MQGFEKDEFYTEKGKELSCDLALDNIVMSTRCFFRSMEHVQEDSSPCCVGVILILGGPHLFAACARISHDSHVNDMKLQGGQ